MSSRDPFRTELSPVTTSEAAIRNETVYVVHSPQMKGLRELLRGVLNSEPGARLLLPPGMTHDAFLELVRQEIVPQAKPHIADKCPDGIPPVADREYNLTGAWVGEKGAPGWCYYCGAHRSSHREGWRKDCIQGGGNKTYGRQIPGVFLTERDWPEDSWHENGNYNNTCSQCKKSFVGHKRRIQCKECANPTQAQANYQQRVAHHPA